MGGVGEERVWRGVSVSPGETVGRVGLVRGWVWVRVWGLAFLAGGVPACAGAPAGASLWAALRLRPGLRNLLRVGPQG